MPSLLVTNDFPPKLGGIQSYLWELWRRLPPGEVTVLTTPHPGAAEFDRAQPFRVVRDRDKVLLPTPALARRIDALAREVGAGVIFLDPALPQAAPLVLGVSRLVPRKGFDVLIDAVARLDRLEFPAGEGVALALAGTGRDRNRLARRAERAGLGGRFHLLGRVPDEDLAAVYGTADVFAMCCRERWAGLEAEGFGIVFLEAAACGLPAVAGRSGGAWEAVEDGVTGFVVDP